MKTSIITLALLTFTAAAHASTYTYAGPDFTTTNNFSGTSVSGSFTTGKLGANLSDALIDPSSWSFTDGQETIDSKGLESRGFFDIWTDAEGNITRWIFEADGVNGASPDEIQSVSGSGDFGGTASGFGRSTTNGTWTETDASPVPEPSSLVLLGSGLLGFAGVIRRKLAA